MNRNVPGLLGGGNHLYENIISRENLFSAWRTFKKGKIQREDVAEFAVDVEEHLFVLHHELAIGTYVHGPYASFFVEDPKLRHIHKASVWDRVLHQAVMRVLEPIFDTMFVFDSYSSRRGKGGYAARKRFIHYAWKLSQNDTKTVWVLKCDIKKFFDSIDHAILFSLLQKKITDKRLLALLHIVIESFSTKNGKGVPIGNVTSQLFANVYMNSFDQLVKRHLRIPYYVRYADDFTVLSRNRTFLRDLIPAIRGLLGHFLGLELHPTKVSITTWHQGVDFLGYVHSPFNCTMRQKTKRRMIKNIQRMYDRFAEGNISEYQFHQILQSYSACLKQAIACKHPSQTCLPNRQG